jgi:ferredoxin-NADP reductase
MIKQKIKLLSKKNICDGVVEFEFERPKGFEFKVGQYVNLYIPGSEVAHGKSYTIVSTPDDKSLKFSIRKRGPFSTYIHNLNIGEEMTLEGPEGYFSFEEYNEGLIFIGAGIGVAPLVAYLRYAQNQKSEIKNPKIKVLISNKTESSTPYLEELKKLDTKFFYTADGGKRIDEESVKKVVENIEVPIFICGSINFTNDYWKILRKLGIDDERIITEAFF